MNIPITATSTVLFLLLLGLLFIGFIGCKAPDANLIDSPIVDELEQGMENGNASFDHGEYNDLLTRHVDAQEGVVDYAALQSEEAQLDEYLASIAGVDLKNLDRGEQLALLINAYNAYTLKLIVEHYPGIESIRDISDPWTTERYDVGGYTLSLDQIEHEIIRPLYRDPRIHFAVNCAARSCPYLPDVAFQGERVEQQLEARTTALLSDERFVRVDGDTLRFTRVMDWYEDDFINSDFIGHAPNLAQYIARYTTDEIRAFIDEHDGDPSTSALDYDWALNDAP